MRLVYALVGSVVGLASLFLLSVLPADIVPHRLRQLVQASAIASIGLGLAAADERLLDAIVMDKLLNVSMALAVTSTLGALLLAVRRGDRVALLLLLGWAPVISVFGARLARNFGILAQSDAVDQATFISIGIESLMFSLAIANRFRALKTEHDKVAGEIKAIRIETDTLRRAAHSDFLTGLGNRAAFNQRIHQLFKCGLPFKLLIVDIDNMKDINDSQGHAAGDALLKFVAERLASLASANIHIKRIGGDEFAVLVLQDDLSELHLSTVLKGLQGHIWDWGEISTKISISIGEASSLCANSSETLFIYADLALYEAKRRGRGRSQAFDAEIKERIDRQTELLHAARAGLVRGEFILFYQPIVNLQTKQCVGAEALLRWKHPNLGLLTPTAFLELLDHNEIGPALQQVVFNLALGELKQSRSVPISLAVNFTAMDLRGVASAQRVLRLLAANGINPRSLCIEVTEGVLLGRAADEPLMALNLLHEAGVRIALDDFGTGYASLSHLMQVPFDTLKIDRSFVSGLGHGAGESQQIVKAVIAMGQGLGKKIVAEGIETDEQFQYLAGLGCDMGQGYLFGRPALLPPWHTALSSIDIVQAVA
jgi:diguanylate cyclase (GGDEF)-like protein